MQKIYKKHQEMKTKVKNGMCWMESFGYTVVRSKIFEHVNLNQMNLMPMNDFKVKFLESSSAIICGNN